KAGAGEPRLPRGGHARPGQPAAGRRERQGPRVRRRGVRDPGRAAEGGADPPPRSQQRHRRADRAGPLRRPDRVRAEHVQPGLPRGRRPGGRAGRRGHRLRAVLPAGRLLPAPVRGAVEGGAQGRGLPPVGGTGLAAAPVAEHPPHPRHLVGRPPARERRGGRDRPVRRGHGRAGHRRPLRRGRDTGTPYDRDTGVGRAPYARAAQASRARPPRGRQGRGRPRAAVPGRGAVRRTPGRGAAPGGGGAGRRPRTRSRRTPADAPRRRAWQGRARERGRDTTTPEEHARRAMPTTAREFHLVARPQGEPAVTDFSLVERTLPDPGPGELLIRNLVLSVDPYMRGKMAGVRTYTDPYELDAPMEGGAVGVVEASADPDVPVG